MDYLSISKIIACRKCPKRLWLAVDSYKEAIASNTTLERKAEIRRQLIEYCKLDTFAMVRMWEFFKGGRNVASETTNR